MSNMAFNIQESEVDDITANALMAKASYVYYQNCEEDSQNQSLIDMTSFQEHFEIGAETEICDELGTHINVSSLQQEIQNEALTSMYVVHSESPLDNVPVSNGLIQSDIQKGEIYQNYYVQPTILGSEMVSDLVQYSEVESETMQLNILCETAAAIAGNEQLEMSLANQRPFSFQEEEHTEERNNFELLTQFSPPMVPTEEPNFEHNEELYVRDCGVNNCNRSFYIHSSMSPLLAAVNDITKRDAELQLYLNQALEKDSNDNTELSRLTECLGTTDYIVSDNAVVSRDKATLPTSYLKFGQLCEILKEPLVLAKKFIPHCTKFGPFEGEVHYSNELGLDALQTPRYYPLLIVDETHLLDVTNENYCNWMRYVPLAETYAEQNLHLYLDHGQIFFKTSRQIPSKEILRVGYHSSYASRFLLPYLEPTVEDLQREAQNNRSRNRWNCIDCGEKFVDSQHLQRHISRTHKKTSIPVLRQRQSRRFDGQLKSPSKRLAAIMSKNSIRCRICYRLFMTSESLKQHINRQHRERSTYNVAKKLRRKYKPKHEPSKSNQFLLDKAFEMPLTSLETTTAQITESRKLYPCETCGKKCATPGALKSHLNSHSKELFCCFYCEEKFHYVKNFHAHVDKHKSKKGDFECPLCKRSFAAYHLARKHFKFVHKKQELSCEKCNAKFDNEGTLRRHQLTHELTKKHACPKCKVCFQRKDHVNRHLRNVHKINYKTYLKENTQENSSTEKKSNCETNTTNTESVALISTNYQRDVISNPIKHDSIRNCSDKKSNSNNVKSVSTSSSNRRKQTPTKLKAVDLNNDPVTYVTLSEMWTPVLLSEDFDKSELINVMKVPTSNTSELPSNKSLEEASRLLQETPSAIASSSFSTTTANANPPINENVLLKNTTLNKSQNSNENSKNAESSIFPYICPHCPSAKFKRRGILVNHFTKAHPNLNPYDIESLQQPIIKPQFVYACPYCTKIYKTSTKRKDHILKHHPENKMPPSIRNVSTGQEKVRELVGNLQTNVLHCEHCRRQYTSRNRLLIHYRKAHPDAKVPPAEPLYNDSPTPERDVVDDIEQTDRQSTPCSEVEGPMKVPYFEDTPQPVSPENKLLKLSSAALEFSKFDFLNERVSNDEYNRFPGLFDESPLSSMDASIMERYNHRSVEAQFFEKIGKLL